METPGVYENNYVRFEIKNGIVIGTFKQGPVTLEEAKIIVEERIKLSNGKDFPVLIKDVGLKSIKSDAREYLSSDEAVRCISASAMVANNMFAKHLANFFVKISVAKPKVPTKIFSIEEEAIAWLQQYK